MTKKYLNSNNLPLSIAVFLATDYYDHSESENTYSATTLLKPLKQIVLSERVAANDILIDLSTLVKSRIGTAIHDAIQNAWLENYRTALLDMGHTPRLIKRIRLNPTKEQLDNDPNIIPVYFEQRVKKEINVDGQTITISGKYDFVADGKPVDFKTTSTYTYEKGLNSNNYIQQGSIYKWLNPDLITADILEIIYIFLDWKAYETYKPQYPPTQILSKKYPLNSVEDTDQFIKDKVSKILFYKDKPESEIPPCTEEDLWQDKPKYKYYSNPNNTSGRSTKNFDSYFEANQRLVKDGNKGTIVTVPGKVKACKYCPAYSICEQKDTLIQQGLLEI